MGSGLKSVLMCVCALTSNERMMAAVENASPFIIGISSWHIRDRFGVYSARSVAASVYIRSGFGTIRLYSAVIGIGRDYSLHHRGIFVVGS